MKLHGLKSVVPGWTRLRQSAFAFDFGEVIRIQSTTDKSSDISPKHTLHISAFGETSPVKAGEPQGIKVRDLLRRRMKKQILALLTASCLFSFAPLAFAQLTAQEIVKRSDDLMRGDSQKGTYYMTVITPQWKRRLEIAVTSKGRNRMLLKILSPAKEKGTTTLRVGSEMWNYLPTVERTIKIPPSMMLESWMGSDFANDDLVKESSIVDDYTHAITGESEENGRQLWQITLTPKPGAPVVWEKRVMWIDKKNFTPARDEFYGKADRLIKVLTYSEVKKVDDRLIPTRWEMVSRVKENHKTIIEVTPDVVYNKSVDDDVFTLQNLRKT
jgi:outer membrane lipoprotein-sorting protein